MHNETDPSLSGQVAIVTGGGSGIGKAVTLRLAQKGASVVVVDINAKLLDATVLEAKKLGNPLTPMILKKDVRNEKDMSEMVVLTVKRHGRIDILVHCAGILRGKNGGPRMMADVTLAEWNEVIDVNLKGTFLCNRAVIPTMTKQRNGHIINISSTSGLKGRALDSVYCASKFGVIGLSQSLAEEVRPQNIKVHVILPDAVDTPMWDQNGPIRAPGDALPPSRVAELIEFVLKLPHDTILGDLVISPFKTRRRKKKGSSAKS
jgi:NAD(P)-dependent dehydrogenase (short-subunit alcohol dehydrogenase family)